MLKKIIFILLMILFVSNNSYSQSSWYWVHPNPQGHNLHCTQFINSNVGYASGDGGVVMKTTNAGANWKVFNTGSNISFISVFFVNELTGFAVGGYYESLIKKTTDGGASWFTKDSVIVSGYRSVYFTDAVTGYTVGGSGRIKKTTNAGESWFSQSSGMGGYLYKVKFIDSENGFILADGNRILKTTNAGNDWSWVVTTGFTDVAFLNTLSWYGLKSDGGVFKTTDGGANWIGQYTGIADPFRSVYFLNNDTGFIAGDNYIRKTVNGGNQWTSQTFFDSDFNFVYFFDSGLGLISGNSGNIYKTDNVGSSWSNLESFAKKDDLYSIRFINENTGFAVGGTMYGYSILKTTDKGNLWTTKNSGFNYINYDVDFTDDLTGYVTNSSGRILKTTNGGDNWSFIFYTIQSLKALKFVNLNTGYATSSSGSIYKTENGASSWTQQLAGTFYSLNSLFFVNESTGYAAGDGGKIFKTTNAGTNWNQNTSGTANNLRSVFFTDPLTGYSSGSNVIIKTTNGGNEWTTIVQSTNTNYASMFFINGTTGYCTRKVGMTANASAVSSILKTTNGGINWSSQFLPTNYSLNSLFFQNPELGFVCGEKGSIIALESDGIVNYTFNGDQIPEKFILHQNYPNPFNPVTHLEFGISDLGFVSLKVFDISGAEIVTLVNEKLSPGSYKFKFNGSNYASGVYLYKLTANNFSETKRMILLK